MDADMLETVLPVFSLLQIDCVSNENTTVGSLDPKTGIIQVFINTYKRARSKPFS